MEREFLVFIVWCISFVLLTSAFKVWEYIKNFKGHNIYYVNFKNKK